MDDIGTENIRTRLRENICAERSNRRKERYIKEGNLSDIKKKHRIYNEDDVLAAALALTNNSSNKIEALNILKESFICDVLNIVTFMKVEGASHALIKHLLSHNSMEQLLAMECCCNLSLGNGKTCFKLAKGATPYIINILHGLNYNLMNVALLTLGNLSGGGERTFQLLYAQGFLKCFEHCINISELREASAKAMIMFTKNQLNKLSEEESFIIVKSCIGYYETSVNIQWLIYHFSTLKYIRQSLISDFQLPNRILLSLLSLTAIQSEDIVSVTALLRTLGFLVTDTDGITANILLNNWDSTLHFIKCITGCNYRHLYKELMWVLGNMLRHNSPEVNLKFIKKLDDIRSLITYVPLE